MIITELYEGQGLGNQLWVYCACRSIAEQLNVPFSIFGTEKFKGAEFLDIEFGEIASSVCSSMDTVRVDSGVNLFHERMFFDPDLDYVATGFDKSVLDIRGNVRLEGLFQSEEYFFGDLNRPRTYLKVKREFIERTPIVEDVCILNIRGGEYKRHKGLILPETYWRNAMRNMTVATGIDNFLIVTDDPAYARAFLPKISILKGGIAECYLTIYNAKHLILSNSSFAYFPTKTGIAKSCVIAPMHWARFGNKYSRWASPANLYTSWMWQDVNGALHSYEDCLQDLANTQAHYRDQYYLSTSPSAVIKRGFRGYFPAWVRKPAKKVLALFFSKHIG